MRDTPPVGTPGLPVEGSATDLLRYEMNVFVLCSKQQQHLLVYFVVLTSSIQIDRCACFWPLPCVHVRNIPEEPMPPSKLKYYHMGNSRAAHIVGAFLHFPISPEMTG